MDIRYHGHSCFELSDGSARVVIDPFLKPNSPVAVATAEEVEATHVLVTHGHVDHLADAVALSQNHDAPVVAMVEVANWLDEQGAVEVFDPNLGGTVSFDWGTAKLVQAFHTSTMPGSDDAPFHPGKGTPVGQCGAYVVEIGGVTVYHAGDTCLFGDMELIGERHGVDVFMVPIGGHYTMDADDAAYAAKLVGASTVIPMHYDTFPPIEADAEAFKSAVESQGDSEVVVLEPGEVHSS